MNNNIDLEKTKEELETKGKVRIEQNSNFIQDKNEPFFYMNLTRKNTMKIQIKMT